MATYQFYVDDDRYPTPTLHLADVRGDARACAFAMRFMSESPHHRGVEVVLDNRVVGGFGAVTRPRGAPQEQ